MALEDKDIFNAICARYPEQPMEFIMAQYALARKLNSQIENGSGQVSNEGATGFECASEAQEAETAQITAHKKYTKRNLKVKPQDAIKDDVIYCCICGAERKHLSEKHLSIHGITKEEYKKLCGYPPNQKLMAIKSLEKARSIIGQAQQKKMDKKESA